jgi:hypothetical protein
MIDDRDVWQAATVLLVKRYRDDAMLEASARGKQTARAPLPFFRRRRVLAL